MPVYYQIYYGAKERRFVAVENRTLELDKTHHLSNYVRKAAVLAFSGECDFTAATMVSSNIARVFGTFCLHLTGFKTFVVAFGAFLKLGCKFASLSKTSWKVFHTISLPGTLVVSLNP